MRLEECGIETARGPLPCLLARPEEEPPRTAPSALLLHLVSTKDVGFTKMPYLQTAQVFVDAGYRVLSFSLPNHGERVDARGEGIRGMCAAYLAGDDPFARSVADGIAVVDHCLASGLAAPGRMAASGVSRSGYCALRLAAAEPRLAGVAALAPVTDWRVLQEFSQVRERQDVAALAIDRWAPALAGRPVFLSIGNADSRVGTAECLRFAHAIAAHESDTAGGSRLEAHVVPAAGHALPESWYAAAARFLLPLVAAATGTAVDR